MRNLKSYISILIAILILDGIWIGIIMKDFYLSALEPVMRSQPIIWPLAVFYFAYALSILFLIVKPFHKKGTGTILKMGGWLGFAGYMTFELVNYGILANWPFSIVIADIIWGTFLTAVLSLVGAKFYKS
jgi:uncharacterized membrane protein